MITLHSIIEVIDNVRFVRIFPYMSLMVYCQSLFVCESVRKSQRMKNMTWTESLIMCFIGQFGGTTLASLMIGQPIRFLTSDKLVVALLAAWVTIFCLPYDLGIRALQIPFIRIVCRWFQLLSISFSVTSYGVDYVFKSDHPKAKVGLSMLIATGTISGCGGGVLLRYYNLVNDECSVPRRMSVTDDNIETHSQKLPQDLIRPTFEVKRSFFATLLYIFLIDPFHFFRGYPLFDNATCRLITFQFVLVSTLFEYLGWHIFEGISSLFHGITRVPKEIPAFARRWSFEEINEKSKDM